MSDTKNFSTCVVTAAENGWYIREKGQPDKVFVRWEEVVKHLATRLTTKGATQ